MTVVTMTFSSSDLTNNNDVIVLEGGKTSGPFDILPLSQASRASRSPDSGPPNVANVRIPEVPEAGQALADSN